METIQKPEVKINQLRDKIIETLQNYSRSQVHLWRQVPALAREADLLKGNTSGRYQMADLAGYWPISKKDIHGLRVELQTGEFGPIRLFGDIKLINLTVILRELDASEVINRLKDEVGSLSTTT